jgi:hypothetical protein
LNTEIHTVLHLAMLPGYATWLPGYASRDLDLLTTLNTQIHTELHSMHTEHEDEKLQLKTLAVTPEE